MPPSSSPHLIIFIHGFRGEGEGTFLDFPNRLATILKDQVGKGPSRPVKVIVYPRYETRGELRQAVVAFRAWLEEQVKDWTASLDSTVSGKDVQIYLCGHSMGGLLAADTAIDLNKTKADLAIRGIYAFDTPFFGLHPTLISRQAMDRAEQVTRGFGDATAVLGASMPAARAFSGSRWGTLGAGMALAAAAVGTGVAWYHKEKLSEGLDWIRGHMIFASAVMNEQDMQARYLLPWGIQSTDDEITAHTSMFDPEKNTGYYALGKETAAFILGKATITNSMSSTNTDTLSNSSSLI
ncbi:hypothetical protein BJ684DRAFT_17126 [Piptocephalis cylindrospora]|uniref:AB hydrolase-1 domain-containing protein n=1 Tax=Piptocephalis cylindrospora TaxID=1907219 RepID=A0A4P9Y0V5_9FUNG|nr:hypothetical protein BJ684DRAFT_17126 [Piptocephalis cylindrospora]|eukprot:RKP12375.1 hypothetical protein BJ684DRAFT_17126 [Piptocephalis cylindrospora]